MNRENRSQPNLVVPREEAREKIQARIDKGQQLRELPIRSEAELEDARAEYSNWSSYNSTLLSRLFDSSSIARLYSFFAGTAVSRNPVLATKIGRYRKEVTDKINRLKGILEELELIPEPISNSTAISSQEQTDARGNGVFIVHGHDTEAKNGVARFVENLGLEATILDEKPGGGRTIIEKFEDHASNVGFAIVLLTPDDVGAAKDKQNNLNPRARQNVIFEMGYFVKGLGRGRVCAMSTEEVELPSDLAGVEYIHLDSKGGWKWNLVTEIKAAGLPVELKEVCKK